MLDWSLSLCSLIHTGLHLLERGQSSDSAPQSPWLSSKFEAGNLNSEGGIGPDKQFSATLNVDNRVSKSNYGGIWPLSWLCWRLRRFRYVIFEIFCGIDREKLLYERSKDVRYGTCREKSGGIVPENGYSMGPGLSCLHNLEDLEEMHLEVLGYRDAEREPCSHRRTSIPHQ